MMNLICAIPDHIGWVIVGAVGMLCVVLGIHLGETFAQMWKEWHEDEE